MKTRNAKKQPKAKALFVISAPSGCGKTTLCKKLLKSGMGLVPSISTTTRAPRADERNGVDYHFVSEKKFHAIAQKNGFLEYEGNFGNLYGTPRKYIEEQLEKGRPVLLSIDVKGAMKVKRAYPKESVLLFIVPPSIAVLKKRLKGRKSDGQDAIKKRLSLAKKELAYKDKYDYRVINDELDHAYRKLKKIIISKIKENVI